MRIAAAAVLSIVLCPAGAGAAAPDMKEGLWEITVKMDMPGVPGGMPPQVIKQCFTRKDVENPQRFAPQGGPGSDRCQVSGYQMKGNTASWNWSCSGAEEMTGTGTMTFSGTSYNGTTRMTMKRGGQAQTMTMHYAGKRIGECK